MFRLGLAAVGLAMNCRWRMCSVHVVIVKIIGHGSSLCTGDVPEN